MICSKLIGGLGNQLFQYAIARRLAIDSNSMLILDISGFNSYKLHPVDLLEFRIQGRLLRSGGSLLKKMIQKPLISKVTNTDYRLESGFNFEPKAIEKISSNTLLEGYWQSEKYFASIRETLLEDLELKAAPDVTNLSHLQSIQNSNSAAIHIRRGDYVTNAAATTVHGVLPLSYYKNAIAELETQESEIHYFVFSDDPNWVRENLNLNSRATYVANNQGKGYEDFRLMKSCKHQIIANSTFSWWAAWLNRNPNKRIYAPNRWFNQNQADTRDLIPESWMQIPLDAK